MDESMDPKPHPHVEAEARPPESLPPVRGETLSIWFFVGLLTLVYGIVLVATGVYEHFGHEPNTVLANLQPTFWWGLLMTLFGAFYTIRFRPGRR